jgi:hypothetical protein
MKYLIYDTALDELHTLLLLQKYYGVNESLFKGTKDASLIDVSPWLFQIDDKLKENLDNEMEVSLQFPCLLESPADIHMLATHFRKFIYLTIEGQEYFFRFYDPRVLEKFLPTCNKDQIREFFGLIQYFIAEDTVKEKAIRYWQENGILKQEIISYNLSNV